jgi:signal recognition particle subunit SRP72
MSVDELFRELEAAIAGGDLERIGSVAQRILAQAPDDADAHKCLVRALIQRDDNDAALRALDAAPTAVQSALEFERTYALYRAGRLQDAAQRLAALASAASPHALALRAQIAYAQGDYAHAEALFAQLLQRPGPLSVADVRANWLAARSQLGLLDPTLPDSAAALVSTHEQLFNVACADAAAHRFDSAERLLLQAKAACQRAADAGDVSADDLLVELAPLDVQLAFVRHARLARGADASAIAAVYEDALERLPHTSAVHAVAANNFEALRDAADVFQAQRHLKQAATARLLPSQLATVAWNRAQLALRTNHKDAIAPLVAQLGDAAAPLVPLARAPLDEAATLIRAAADDTAASVGATLEQYLKTNPNAARVVALVAQRALVAGDKAKFVGVLQSVPDLARYPALAGAAFAIMSDAGSAGAVEWLQRLAAEQLAPRTLQLGVGRALLKLNRNAEAAKLFDALVARNKRDAEAVALLIEACAVSDPQRAAELSTRLPPLPAAVGFDIELELADSPDATRLTAIAAQVSGDGAAPDAAAAAAAAKVDAERRAKKRAHRRKYRKIILPKGVDPANPQKGPKPDAERWIPKRLRTKAKGGKVGGRGAQGGGKTEEPTSGKAQIFDAHAAPAPKAGGGGKRGGKGGKGKKR